VPYPLVSLLPGLPLLLRYKRQRAAGISWHPFGPFWLGAKLQTGKGANNHTAVMT
jgi:hypothetical protein